METSLERGRLLPPFRECQLPTKAQASLRSVLEAAATTVYSSAAEALRRGAGFVYQDKGDLYVTGPAGATKLMA